MRHIESMSTCEEESIANNQPDQKEPSPISQTSEHEDESLHLEHAEEMILSQSDEDDDPSLLKEEAEELDPSGMQEGDNRESSNANKEKKTNFFINALTSELEALPDPDAKLQKAMDFMEASLAQSGTPHFKSFWEARSLCLQLFKENITPMLRSQLWAKYSELSKEARRLKEILDEQSAFAAEQIEIAIKALENDLAQFQQHIDAMPPIQFSIVSESLKHNMAMYLRSQQELNLLNAQASRINALRKELIKTDMRVRVKNKFFQRLSQIGDQVFPRRKELIKDVSNRFIQDVDQFIADYFTTEQFDQSIFFLREEIKSLQGIAKILTLNTHSFTHTRMRLSECWDKIKHFEKERKKARAQQKAFFKQNVDIVKSKIDEFEQNFASGQISILDGQKQLDEIASFMRTVELGRDELQFLREQLASARKPILEKIKNDEQERLQQDQERQRSRKKKLQDLRDETDSILNRIGTEDIDTLIAERDALSEKIAASGLSKPEKQEMERMHKDLRNALTDALSERKEKALLSLSDDRRQAIEQLREILEERRSRRQEIKNQLKLFRKASGSSGLTFQQAMTYNAQIQTEEERLEKINFGIKEIEDKLEELESEL